MCEHRKIVGDNYGETCGHCGKKLSGYGYGARQGPPCICRMIPLSGSNSQYLVCEYCQREELNPDYTAVVPVIVYTVKIKSAITELVWYYDKIGETYKGVKHYTDSLFWFPGRVFKTPNGYIHELDAEILKQEQSIDPINNN
jgi:hypothetical protein